MRQIAAVFAELEKKRLVKKLQAARDCKRAAGLKVEGRKSYAELAPEAVERTLRRSRLKGGQRTLREISGELARTGFLTRYGKPYAAAAVAKMVPRGTDLELALQRLGRAIGKADRGKGGAK